MVVILLITWLQVDCGACFSLQAASLRAFLQADFWWRVLPRRWLILGGACFLAGGLSLVARAFLQAAYSSITSKINN